MSHEKFKFNKVKIYWIIFLVILAILIYSWVSYGTLIPPQIGNFIYSLRGNTIKITWQDITREQYILQGFHSCKDLDRYAHALYIDFIFTSCSKHCSSAAKEYRSLDNGYVLCLC